MPVTAPHCFPGEPGAPRMHRSVGRKPCRVAVLCWWLLTLLPACAPEVPDHVLRIQVVAAAPVADAEVFLWWLDRAGHPLRRDGRRTPNAEFTPANALLAGRTDERGFVELHTGSAYGAVVLMARKGQTRDPWLDSEGGEDPASSLDPLGVELRGVARIFPDAALSEVLISPLTSLAMRIGERRLAQPEAQETFDAAMLRAFTMIGTHFGGIELTVGLLPVSADQPLGALDAATKHVLAIQGLASLAHRIAAASGLSSGAFHTLHLLQALLADVSDARGLLDGVGTDGQIEVGACLVPDGCADDPACRPICMLDANTLRAHLAAALAFDFLSAPHNLTTLSLEDIRSFLEHLQTNDEPELFGDADIIELDSPAPILAVNISPVFDERLDEIAFDENAVPTHTPAGDALIDLGQAGACPDVGKHLHRLADAGDNPLRWHVVVRDRTGWPGQEGIPTSLQYRVRLRDPAPPGDLPAGSCEVDGDEHAWLTDWRTAEPVSSTDEGTLYEIVLLRERVPALAELEEAELEIVFRGQDALGRAVIACRCWNHILLPPPLEVGEIELATGPGSLAARSLNPGNNLAPLLNGLPLDQGVVLASFALRNGTDAPAYVGISVTQPLVDFTKCWQRGNAVLAIDSDPEIDCVIRKTCLSDLPADRYAAEYADTGVIEDLISGWRVVDMLNGTVVPPGFCAACGATRHLVEPRADPVTPRVYRVELLISDLNALAPRTSTDPPELYREATLAAPLTIPISGNIYEGILDVCDFLESAAKCNVVRTLQYHRALAAASLTMRTPLGVQLEAFTGMTASGTSAPVSRALETFEWVTREQALPSPFPNLEVSVPWPIGSLHTP